MKKLKIPKRIRDNFPAVTTVCDATESIAITVKPVDSSFGKRKDPQKCALVHACKRQHIADGAIIGVGYSWLIKGSVATRYKTSESVAREIVSFDRHHDFAAGVDYVLGKVAPQSRLGVRNNPIHGRNSGKEKLKIIHAHRTVNIRRFSR